MRYELSWSADPARVTACGAAYVEVITDAHEAPPMYTKLHENVESSTTPLAQASRRLGHHDGRIGRSVREVERRADLP